MDKKTQELGTIGKIVLDEEIINVIDNLHSAIGSTEWSGILFYKLTKGNLFQMKDLEFTVDFIFPMNIGSHTYTEFEYSGKVMDAYDINENLINSNSGMVHTHHNMQAFFSNTDSDELLSNATNFNYYLSLIVSFDRKYKCKVAFPSKTKVLYNSSIKGTDGKLINIKSSTEEDIILIGDLDIDMPTKFNSINWLNKRIDELKKEKTAIKPVQTFGQQSWQKQYNFKEDWNDDYNAGWLNQGGNSDLQTLTKTYKKTGTVDNFLKKLISLNSGKYYSSIGDAMEKINNELSKDEEIAYDEYEVAMETNLEIIHDFEFGSDSNLRKNCLEACSKMEDLRDKFETNPIFDITINNLLYGIQ